MTKETPHPIDDATLLAYLEGLVSPEIKAEIEASPWLMAQARQLAREEARLRLFLAPPEDENNLELLSPGLLQRARVEIARLIKPTRGSNNKPRGVRSPQPILVRGMSGEEHELNQQVRKLAFATDDLFIAVEIAPDTDNAERYKLRGYMLGCDECDAQADIRCNDVPLLTVGLDDEDEFFVDKLLPGDYQIVITTPNRCIELESFSIS